MNNNIALMLRQLRKTSHMTAKEAASQLKQYDMDIAPKTIYGYESGLSMPNADVFTALCNIYHCKNAAENVRFHAEDIPFNENELSFLYDFQALDTFGQDIVRQVLEHEKERIRRTENNQKS